MHVWLMHIGEDLPIDQGDRLYRYGYLANAICQRGGSVLRWAPTLCHTTKQHRSPSDYLARIQDGYDIQLVRAPGYRAHIGLRRVRMHQILAKRFREMAPRMRQPDVIVAAIPSLEWAAAAVEYGKKIGVPVVVDVRDIWPDLFESVAPLPLRPIARIALKHYSKLADQICADADALTGVSQSYLDWALRRASRDQRDTDSVTPIGCDAIECDSQVFENLRASLVRKGFDPSLPTGCYLGQFARSSDLTTVLHAAHQIQAQNCDMQLLLCGEGAKREELQRRATGLRGVHFLGWVDAKTMSAVMKLSQFGLCAYSPKATQSWPNKPFEYMAGRLAIVSSLTGDLEKLVSDEGIGFTYQSGDADTLAKQLLPLLEQPSLLEDYQTQARALWQRRFRPSVIYDQFAHQLEGLTYRPAYAA